MPKSSPGSSTNLRVAETEKYPHVSYFFNCGIEKPYPGEDRILIPSPKVPTYDLQPEMSAKGITDTLVADVEARKHDVIICNFANADMVGHTGNIDAAVKAVETIDQCLGRIVRAVRDADGTLLVTSDHGNAEEMWNTVLNEPHTAHTCNPVPVIVVEDAKGMRLREGGSLRDIAPTMLGDPGSAGPEGNDRRGSSVVGLGIRNLGSANPQSLVPDHCYLFDFFFFRLLVGGDPQRTEKTAIVRGHVERAFRSNDLRRCRYLYHRSALFRGLGPVDESDYGLEGNLHLEAGSPCLLTTRLDLRIICD